MGTNRGVKAKTALGGSISPIDSDSDDSFGEIDCDICNKTFTNSKSYEQHMNSQKHYKQVVKNKALAKKREVDKLLNPDTQENGEAEDTEFHCKDCDMTFSGHKPYMEHKHGSVHEKNVKKRVLKEKMKDTPGLSIEEEKYEEDGFTLKPVAKCTLCNKDFTGIEAFKNHMDSKPHKKKLREQKIADHFKNDKKDHSLDEDFYTRCEICDKGFSGFQPFYEHMNSLAHEKTEKRIQAIQEIKSLCTEDSTDSKLICKECQKPFTDPAAFKAHIANNSHEKYKIKDKILELVNTHPEIIAGKTIKNEFVDEDENEEFQVGNLLMVCKLCHTAFSGPENALDHLKSKKHLKVKEEKEKIKQYLKNKKAKASKQDENTQPADKKSEVKKDSSSQNATAVNGKTAKEAEHDDFELI